MGAMSKNVEEAVTVVISIVIGFVLAQGFLNSQSTTSLAYTSGNSILTSVSSTFTVYVPLAILLLILLYIYSRWQDSQQHKKGYK